MCGIVGYVGSKPVIDILLNGLSKLEYRGYDSAGVAVNSEGKIKVYKAEGKLQNLKDLLEEHKAEIKDTTAGIGLIQSMPTLTHATVENLQLCTMVLLKTIKNSKKSSWKTAASLNPKQIQKLWLTLLLRHSANTMTFQKL